VSPAEENEMFDIWGSGFRNCDRISRRNLLKIGSLVFGGAALGERFRDGAAAGTHAYGVVDTAVIQVFLGGGPSHIDMFDLKPNAPAEIRGEFNEISTNVSGIRISEHLPMLAAVMDKMSIVRSVTHTNSSHLPSSHWLQTGFTANNAVAGHNLYPSTGSITARMRGPNAPGLPAYVAVPRCQAFAYSAYLGEAYNPFTTDIDPNDENFYVPNLRLVKGISHDRLKHRGELLKKLDGLRHSFDASGDLAGLDRFNHDAINMITDPKTAQAFDIRRESSQVRERYGRTGIGQNCLLARRLVEAGVTYVSCLSGGGWDTHANNFRDLKQTTLPRLDRAISALITDLHDRGLDKRVLVNVMGEFGRTPKINKDAGRDHWPGAMCVLFSGGGLKMGQMIGATDKQAAFPTSKPFSPSDILATIYHVLGIDWRRVFHDQSRRPIPILSQGDPIADLI
jgi:hypothetical protein